MNAAKHSDASGACKFFAAHGWRLTDDVAYTDLDDPASEVSVFTLFKDDADGTPLFMVTPIPRDGMDWPESQEHWLNMANAGWARYQEESR